MANDPAPESRALFGLSTAVYAQRGGKILVLKRALGEAVGGWWLPGGAGEAGEDIEEAARRELFEESGLTPTGPLTLLGANRIHVYGGDVINLSFVCECLEGDVVLSDEHSGYRWVDAQEFRDRSFNDEVLAALEQRDARIGNLVRTLRSDLDRYIAMRNRQKDVRPLTADVFVVRDEKILVLERGVGQGRGFWMPPGGIVEPGEDPAEAARRETLEETGLDIGEPTLLRVWGYEHPRDGHVYHATYWADAPDGDVRISIEHTDYRWMPIDDYIEAYCHARFEATAPQYASFLRQLRHNCELMQSVLQA